MQLKTNTAEFISEHEVILQTLDNADIPGVESGLSSISGKPIPYGLKHPDGGFQGKDLNSVFNQDLEEAGVMGDAWISYTGRPTLRAKINITNPEIEQKIKKGDVFISDAYWHDQATSYISSFNFDHLLIYPRESKIPQGEPAALIINQTSEVNNLAEKTDEPTSLEFARALLTQNQGELDTKKAEILTLNQQIAEKDGIIAQKDKTISEKETLITNQTKEIEQFKADIKAAKLAEIKQRRELAYNQYPKGIRDKFEPKKADFFDDEKRDALILEMNQEWAKVPQPVYTQAEGTQFTVNQTQDDVAATQTRLSGTRMKVNYNEEVQ